MSLKRLLTDTGGQAGSVLPFSASLSENALQARVVDCGSSHKESVESPN